MMILLLTLLLPACSGSGDFNGGGGGGDPQGPFPTVLATLPVDGATDIPLNSAISALFSTPMRASTLKASTFVVTGPGGLGVPGEVTYDSSSNTATFAPTANLAPNSLFTARLTTDVWETSGNALRSDFVWSFTTGVSLDATPPTVTSTTPPDGASSVATNTSLTATFSEPMSPGTLDESSFTVTASEGPAVAGTVTYAPLANTATFTPTADLAPNTTFTATITTGATDLNGNPLAADFVWTFSTGDVPDTTAPSVISTTPVAEATGVPTNTRVNATFDGPMDPASVNGTTFTVTGPGNTPVAGLVLYAAVGNTATFNPAGNLAPNTQFTATVTTGATDVAGNPLSANFVWTFTTGATADTTAPTVVSTNPENTATGVCLTEPIEATFSEAMDPVTLSTATFRVTGPGATLVTGTVAYNALTFVATFSPIAPLATNTQFTVTLSGGAAGVRDVEGNPLAVDRVWTFTTGTQACAPDEPTVLGAIAPFGTFGGGAGMTNQGLLTVVNGDIGTTGASTTITGFHDTSGDSYTETPLNAGTVNGTIFSAPPAPGTQEKADIAAAGAAAALAAFNDLSPANLPGGTDPGAGQLGGLTLAPGVYQAAGGTFQITGSDLTLDAQGDPDAVWVFQSAASLTVGAPGFPRSVILINGAQARNVYWRVGSAATINEAGGGTMVGTILASAGVTFSTAGNMAVVTLNGRAIGLNASVTLVNTVINVPAP